MNESTTITIDNIVKLIEGIAKAEYQRGYVNGMEEERLTQKHWGKKNPAIEDIKAELRKAMNKSEGIAWNRALFYAIEMIDKHTSGKEIET